jgi:nicotinate-nucleotide adenylyltransferase
VHHEVPRRGRGAGPAVARVGILGGSFNPPHVGHLVCAQEAHAQLGLDVVVLMPVGVAPHKAMADPGSEHRLELCRLATAGDARLAVSRLELDRPGPSYTVDTLRALHARAPDDELILLLGGDMAHSLPAWHEPEVILELATVAVAERAGTGREDIRAALSGLRGGERAAFFDMPRLDVSSSAIRRRVAADRPIRYLVPDPVVSYIGAHGLYTDPPADGRAA